MKIPEKELDPPPAHEVVWLGRLKDGRSAVIRSKLWYAAREALCQMFGVSHDSVLDVHSYVAPEPALCLMEYGHVGCAMMEGEL